MPIDVMKLKLGDRFVGVVESKYANNHTTKVFSFSNYVNVLLAADVVESYVVLPAGTSIEVGQIGLFEFVELCVCGCKKSIKCILVGDTHTWETS
mgnify:CR=1 FL=1